MSFNIFWQNNAFKGFRQVQKQKFIQKFCSWSTSLAENWIYQNVLLNFLTLQLFKHIRAFLGIYFRLSLSRLKNGMAQYTAGPFYTC